MSLALIHDALDSDGLLDKEKYNSSSLDERRTEDDRMLAKKCHFMQLLSIISQKTQNFFFSLIDPFLSPKFSCKLKGPANSLIMCYCKTLADVFNGHFKHFLTTLFLGQNFYYATCIFLAFILNKG